MYFHVNQDMDKLMSCLKVFFAQPFEKIVQVISLSFNVLFKGV
jgi:hypothetical protein